MFINKNIFLSIIFLVLSIFTLSCSEGESSVSKEIIGWNILSSNEKGAEQVINAAQKYGVNQLQLSHQIIHNLKDIRDTSKAEAS